MILGSTYRRLPCFMFIYQPLTDMSTRNLPVVKSGWRVKPDKKMLEPRRLTTYGLSLSVTVTALLF
jgi:hypothetical protein